MRTLVLGAGAVGGYFGGRLAEAGRDVTFLVRPARAALLGEQGLKVTSPLGDFTVKPQIATADRTGGPYDLILLTAKHYDLDQAIEAIRPAVGPRTAVLPMLNGLVHLDRLAAAFGAEAILGGVAYVGASLQPDGSIRHHNQLSGIAFGERAGGVSTRTQAISAEFVNTKVSAPPSENVMLDMWEKFVMITTMAGMNCLMRGTIGDLAATDDGAALILELFAETQAVAAASGYPVRPAYREQIGKMLTEKGSPNNASMHHDLAHGSRTEGDYIVGDMRRRAAALGIATPLLRAAYAHLQVYENRRAAQG
ncbi:MAG TPA: 2-dehydropantoate 2-reductase [Stellaceae bacterium]|jgi:2-dehydropantoate 2-reductase|nr:2-dehydropantoate 2-reductase [Stellaceae bacterium]